LVAAEVIELEDRLVDQRRGAVEVVEVVAIPEIGTDDGVTRDRRSGRGRGYDLAGKGPGLRDEVGIGRVRGVRAGIGDNGFGRVDLGGRGLGDPRLREVRFDGTRDGASVESLLRSPPSPISAYDPCTYRCRSRFDGVLDTVAVGVAQPVEPPTQRGFDVVVDVVLVPVRHAKAPVLSGCGTNVRNLAGVPHRGAPYMTSPNPSNLILGLRRRSSASSRHR